MRCVSLLVTATRPCMVFYHVVSNKVEHIRVRMYPYIPWLQQRWIQLSVPGHQNRGETSGVIRGEGLTDKRRLSWRWSIRGFSVGMIGSPNFESMNLLKAKWLVHFSWVNLYSHNSHLQKNIDSIIGCLNWNTPRDMNLLWRPNMSSVLTFIRREIRKLETFGGFQKWRVGGSWRFMDHSPPSRNR